MGPSGPGGSSKRPVGQSGPGGGSERPMAGTHQENVHSTGGHSAVWATGSIIIPTLQTNMLRPGRKGIVVLWLKPLLGTPVSFIRMPGQVSATLLPFQLPVKASWAASDDGSVLGPQLPRGLLALALDVAGICEITDGRLISPSVAVFLGDKNNFFKKIET